VQLSITAQTGVREEVCDESFTRVSEVTPPIITGVLLVVAIRRPGPLAAQGDDSEAVLKAREAALAAGDRGAVMKSFATDAIAVSSSGRVLIGLSRSGNGSRTRSIDISVRKPVLGTLSGAR
jgi:hypothetical protein